MACQRQHRNKVQLVVMLCDVLQHLHHGGGRNQVVAREAGSVGNDRVTNIDTRLLAQDLAYGIGTCAPGARDIKSRVADHTKNGVSNHVVRLFQHNLKQVM